MEKRLKFPLRFKILVSQLLVVSVVLSLITFTMGNRFQLDKTAYIHDLTSTVVLHTAAEASSLMLGYQERLKLFGRVMAEEGIDGNKVLKGLFEEFGEFVMVTRTSKSGEQVVYDAAGLAAKGVTKDDLLRFRGSHPLPAQDPRSAAFVENSTVSPKLPTLTLTIWEQPEVKGGEVVRVSGVIRLDKLLGLARRSRVFETFLLDSNGGFLAHTDRSRISTQAEKGWWERVSRIRGPGMTMEYQSHGTGMVGGFSRVSCGGLVAGVQIPKSAAYLTSRQLLNELLLLSLGLLGAAALLSLFWSHRLTRPIEELSEATTQVGQGRFEIEVKAGSGDEIGALGDSFNRMAGELKAREKALKELYSQLIQSEKMAAFGSLGAGIAHEVKNPLAGILGITQLSMRKVQEGDPLEKNLKVIEKETNRCKTIIENLLKFARQEQVAFDRVDIAQVMSDSVAIVEHQLGINSIRIEKDLEEGIPACNGNANQLQQVLMNLMINAQQAMAGGSGTVRLEARKTEQGGVELRVSDTGPGIPKEIQKKIFDPFFTTKPAGQGTGLGLSVTYGIVKDHGGEIRIESEEGGGATFVITLPATGAAVAAA